MLYESEDKLGKRDMLLYGLQWFSVTIPSLIILSGIVAGMYFDDAALMTVYLQKCFLVSGLALLAQILWGHRMPIVIGPSSILLIGLASTQSLSPEASFTTIALGGAAMFLLSFSRIFHSLQKIFTSRVIVVTLLLVGIGMMPMVIGLAEGVNGDSVFNIAFAIVLAFLLILLNHVMKGFGKSLVIMIGLIVGSVAYFLMQGVPDVASDGGYRWSLLFDNFFIKPEFDLSAIIAFSFCFLALMINELGSIQATGGFIRADRIGDRCQRGVRVSGFFNMISGMMGQVGLLNFSLSPGVIAATRNASRYPLLVTVALLILCAVIPQFLFVFSYIPTVVMGALMLYLMAIQIGAGLQMMVADRVVTAFDSMITVSFPILIGIFVSFAPAEFKVAVPPLLQPVLTNGFVMGIIAVLLLDNILCRGSDAK